MIAIAAIFGSLLFGIGFGILNTEPSWGGACLAGAAWLFCMFIYETIRELK